MGPLQRRTALPCPTDLSETSRRQLKRLAHHRKPLVQVGAAGLSAALIAEIDHALTHHELIKVKLGGADRRGRDAMAQAIAERTRSWLIQRIGGIGTFYRENTEQPAISQTLERPRAEQSDKHTQT